jgi:hypothetical protein
MRFAQCRRSAPSPATLGKRPVHIAAAFHSDDVRAQLPRVAQLVCWAAIEVAAREVTLFDAGGALAAAADEFGAALDAALLARQRRARGEQHSAEAGCAAQSAGLAIGVGTGPIDALEGSVRVRLLSAKHGRGEVTRGAMELARQPPHTRASLDSAGSWAAAAPALAASHLSEPQLLLVVSSLPSLLGFPPWLARQCEIARVGAPGPGLRAEFCAALARYAASEQRSGT